MERNVVISGCANRRRHVSHWAMDRGLSQRGGVVVPVVVATLIAILAHWVGHCGRSRLRW